MKKVLSLVKFLQNSVYNTSGANRGQFLQWQQALGTRIQMPKFKKENKNKDKEENKIQRTSIYLSIHIYIYILDSEIQKTVYADGFERRT